MERRHHGQHGETCFGCRVQTIQFSPAALPVKSPEHRQKNPPKTSTPMNSWERGIPTDSRNMPYLQGASITPHNTKSFVDNRHRITEGIRRSRSGATNS